MTETFKCPACGAANNLPEGKTSMACMYCGASIHQPPVVNNNLQGKPRLSKVVVSYDDDAPATPALTYIDRNIRGIDQVTEIYSDNELWEFSELNLPKNKIKSVNGLQRFILDRVDLSSNEIEVIDHLPKRTNFSHFTMDFSNNKNLNGFSDDMISEINTYTNINLYLIINGCDKFNLEQLSKINFSNFKSFDLRMDSSRTLPDALQRMGFAVAGSNANSSLWRYQSKPIVSNGSEAKKGGCFIATATMGSYDHPQVVELRNFRDKWILDRRWGQSFVSWYYHYGAIAAKFIESSLTLRRLSYWFIVKPLVFLSRLLK